MKCLNYKKSDILSDFIIDLLKLHLDILKINRVDQVSH